jgi:hypothetical protein
MDINALIAQAKKQADAAAAEAEAEAEAARLARIQAQRQDGIRAITQALRPELLQALAGEKPAWTCGLTKSKQNVREVWLKIEQAGLTTFLIIATPKYLVVSRYHHDDQDYYTDGKYGTHTTTPPPVEVWPFAVYLLPEGSSLREAGIPINNEDRPATDFVGEFLLARKREQEEADAKERAGEIKTLLNALRGGNSQRPATPEAAQAMVKRLRKLAPDFAGEIADAHKFWTARYEQDVKERAYQTRQDELQAACEETYFTHLRDAAEIIRQNAQALDALQTELNVPFVLHTLEYGIAAVGDDETTYLETRTVQVTTPEPNADGCWTVVSDYGHTKRIRYFNVVSIEAGVTYRPSSGLSARRVKIHPADREIFWNPLVSHTEGEILSRAETLCQPLPEPPDAPDELEHYRVQEAHRRARNRVRKRDPDDYDPDF